MSKFVKRSSSGKPRNESFFTMKNQLWINYMLQGYRSPRYTRLFDVSKSKKHLRRSIGWLPLSTKPLVFLPCGKAEMTRGKNGRGERGDMRKFISEGLGHSYLKDIRTEPTFEKVILSEPLVIIPYRLESHKLRPDYNLPPESLTIQGERYFIQMVGMFLAKLKIAQPKREYIYYIGSTHHYFILKYANRIAGYPFEIIHKVPSTGLAGYARAATEFKNEILELELAGKKPSLQEPSLEKMIKGRGSYTKRKFWYSIWVLEQISNEEKQNILASRPKAKFKTFLDKNKKEFEFSVEQFITTTNTDWINGFEEFYPCDFASEIASS